MPAPPGPHGTPAVVGLDVGTTSAKAVAYDVEARAWASAGREYPLRSPRPRYAEQDAAEVCDAAVAVLADTVAQASAAGADVRGVCLSAAMHSLLAVDDEGRPLTPALTYADGRATAEAVQLRDVLGGLEVSRRTGTPPQPMSPLAKLLWFRAHAQATFERAAGWRSLKELLVRRLTGQEVVDASIASASGLYNLAEGRWDAGALRLASVDAGQLSRVVSTGAVLDGPAGTAAERLGLPPGLPVVAGAADGCLANLGAGAVTPDVAVTTIGTSAAVRVVADRPDTDAKGRLFTYVLSDDRWVVGGPVNNGGLALRWVRDELLPDVAEAARDAGREPYDDLVALAERVPAGAEGLLFLPYLTGERAPWWNPLARGVLYGLTLRHGRGHLVRAALEGVLLHLRAVVAALAELGLTPSQVRATGGFASSPLWLQLMADVFGRRIQVPSQVEGTCLGAALLGMTALGMVGSLDEAAGAVTVTASRRPDPDAAAVYDGLQPLFERIYWRLEGTFADLDRLQLPRR